MQELSQTRNPKMERHIVFLKLWDLYRSNILVNVEKNDSEKKPLKLISFISAFKRVISLNMSWDGVVSNEDYCTSKIRVKALISLA